MRKITKEAICWLSGEGANLDGMKNFFVQATMPVIERSEA